MVIRMQDVSYCQSTIDTSLSKHWIDTVMFTQKHITELLLLLSAMFNFHCDYFLPVLVDVSRMEFVYILFFFPFCVGSFVRSEIKRNFKLTIKIS